MPRDQVQRRWRRSFWMKGTFGCYLLDELKGIMDTYRRLSMHIFFQNVFGRKFSNIPLFWEVKRVATRLFSRFGNLKPLF